jgi:hypothetical protein
MRLKINQYKLVAAVAGLFLVGSSCSDDKLELEPEGVVAESNYYQNETQAYSGLIAVYDVMKKQSGGFENMISMLNAGSDDHFAGGGGATDGTGIHSFSDYSISGATIPASYWNDFYQGIFRANVLLQKLPNVPMADNTKARFAAEAKALRAFYYFQLVTTFRNIPLQTTPIAAADIYTITQADPNDVYAQIEADLTDAIADLPPVITDMTNEAGRFTKGAAQALLGKVYLFQQKNAEAAAQFAEVNGVPGGTSQYGNHLLANYADLWVVDNKFNAESILEATHTQRGHTGWGNWGSGSDEGNSLNQMVGPRSYASFGTAPDYVSGWCFNTVTPDLYNALSGDPRFASTILDMAALVAANQASYSPGYQDTGYFLKKFMPTTADITNEAGQQELNYRQNTYVIRLADTYLMEAEALGGTGARAQALLDAVRSRVGLTSVPVSLTAIYNERRLELAGEGHRWFDLVRTNRAATVLASRGFTANKNEIWPIPLGELTNTQIVQNPGY